MAFHNTFIVTGSCTPGAAANVLLEIAANSAKPLEIIDVEISQATNTSNIQVGVQHKICSTATTGWTSPQTLTPAKGNPSDATASMIPKMYNTSGTTSDGSLVESKRQTGWNILIPYFWQPPTESRLFIAAGQYYVLKWITAPPAATVFYVNVTVTEIG